MTDTHDLRVLVTEEDGFQSYAVHRVFYHNDKAVTYEVQPVALEWDEDWPDGGNEMIELLRVALRRPPIPKSFFPEKFKPKQTFYVLSERAETLFAPFLFKEPR